MDAHLGLSFMAPTGTRKDREGSNRNQSRSKTNQAGLEDRPDWVGNDFLNDYAMRLLRKIRSVLAPNGRRSNAPAIIVVASGTAVKVALPRTFAPVFS